MKTLKKIIKFFRNLFRTIGSFIDRFIVTPVTKFAMFIGEKLIRELVSLKDGLIREILWYLYLY